MAKRKQTVWNETETAARNARRELPGIAADYFQHGRRLFGGEASPAALHRFRLRSKRFRYTLELFRACYGPTFEKRLQSLRQIQQFLGEINDCDATRRIVAAGMPKASRLKLRIERFLEKRTQGRTDACRRYWREVFDASGQESAWRNYLARSRS